jgi:hypothetical protein
MYFGVATMWRILAGPIALLFFGQRPGLGKMPHSRPVQVGKLLRAIAAPATRSTIRARMHVPESPGMGDRSEQNDQGMRCVYQTRRGQDHRWPFNGELQQRQPNERPAHSKKRICLLIERH